jgi:hypothetical protein
MRMLVRIACLLMLFILPAAAQDTSTAPQDQSTSTSTTEKPPKEKAPRITPKYEISGGYSYRSYYQLNGLNPYLNGWYVSADRNFFHWLGAEGEVSGVYKNQGVIVGDTGIYSFMVGPRIYPLGHRKLTPYAHLLFGASVLRNTVGPFSGFGVNTDTTAVHSWEGGGGLDYNLSSHWGIQILQFDFGVSNFTGSNNNQGFRRITVGAVYRFGKK